jgi:hypothetical protein
VSEASSQASNGKAERIHRTIFNMVRCMIFESGLAPTFWSDTAEYATYILNRSPSRANTGRHSPIQVLTDKSSSLRDVVAIGSSCTVRRDPKKKTLQKRAVLGRVLGKNDRTKGYRVYLPSERIVIITQHIRMLSPDTLSPIHFLPVTTAQLSPPVQCRPHPQLQVCVD